VTLAQQRHPKKFSLGSFLISRCPKRPEFSRRGMPLGGALFALEVMRGMLALRFVLPALVTSLVATAVSWVALPNAPTYVIPADSNSISTVVWALVAGPIAGVISVGYVRMVAWADRHKPQGWMRMVLPVLALGLLGAVSIPFPQLLGNGKDIAQLAFAGQVAPALLLALLQEFLRSRRPDVPRVWSSMCVCLI
jgi:CIC family chloride channel protein